MKRNFTAAKAVISRCKVMQKNLYDKTIFAQISHLHAEKAQKRAK